MQNFHGQMNVLKGEIERWKKGNYSVVFLGPDEERVKKVGTCTLEIMILMQSITSGQHCYHGRVQIIKGDLHTGFELQCKS